LIEAMETAQVAESEAAAREALVGDPDAQLVMGVGRAYHQAGAASDQLEELMGATARALGLELQVTALPTSITAAIGPGYAQKVVLLRLQPGNIDLRRLSLLNVVFERIVHGEIATDVARAEVDRIAALRHAARPLQCLTAYTLLSLGASIILGGHENENIAAALVGLAVGGLSVLGQRSPTVARLFEVLAAFLATAIVTLYGATVHPLNVYVPLVAGVIQLLPGLQLTAALHELAYQNLVAGTARLGGVLMTLLSLGCGFALGIAIFGPGQMHVGAITFNTLPWYQVAFAVAAIGGAIAILENARPVDVPLVLASCAVAEVAYRLFAMLPGHQVATFGAALVVGLVTSLGARVARLPQAVLLVPGLLILVPGSLSYESILYVLQSNNADAAAIAVNSIFAAVEIVAGLLLAQLLLAPAHLHDHP
jgi:uncharacterized membrane protein YjjP (DUF1212 family)